MATHSSSPQPLSPAKTKAELSWFKERRKRWENAPRNRVVPVSSDGSPISRLTSGVSAAATQQPNVSKQSIVDSKPALTFGAQKQPDCSSPAVKASLGAAFSALTTASANSKSASSFKSEPTTKPLGSSLFSIPPRESSPMIGTSGNTKTSIFGGTSTPTNPFGVKSATSSEQNSQKNSLATDLSSSSSMSKPLFGSAFGEGGFGFGSNTASSKDTPLFGASSSSGGLFGAMPRNKGTKPNPFAMSKVTAVTASIASAPSAPVTKSTPALGAFASMEATGSVGGSVGADSAAASNNEESNGRETIETSEQAKTSAGQSHRDRLVEFYKQYNPDKLGKVDETLASYKGKEDELFRKLKAKYVKNNSKFLPPSGEGPTCFMDFSIGDDQTKGRVTVKLYKDKAPLACENFRSLCTGEKGIGQSGKPLCYKNSKVHRIVPQFCVQLGDFTKANGTGGEL